MRLTLKQQRFVEEYVVDFNAAAAARRAGYSERTAKEIGTENLTKPHIAAAIAAATAKLSKAAELTAAEIWQEWRSIGRSDIGEIMDFTGAEPRLRPACDIPESARRAIKSVKVKRYVEGHGDDAQEVEMLEFALWDKPGMLATVARALGMLKDRVEHTGKDGAPMSMKVEHSGNISNEPSLTASDALFAESLAEAAVAECQPVAPPADEAPAPTDTAP